MYAGANVQLFRKVEKLCLISCYFQGEAFETYQNIGTLSFKHDISIRILFLVHFFFE